LIPFRLHRRIPLLRRPFHQRDQAIAARDALAAERDALRRERAEAAEHYYVSWMRHRPVESTLGSLGAASASGPPDDDGLVLRVTTAYRAADATDVGDTASFWLNEFARVKQADHTVLLDGDLASAATLLRNPARSQLFFGFDDLFDHSAWPQYQHRLGHILAGKEYLYDLLLRIAEAVGVRRLHYPEILGPGGPPAEVESILADLDQAFGFHVTFPNPFPEEIGLATSRGVASFRAIQSLYQAHRIVELAGRAARVVEIGGGLGRTAYYARKFGIRDYTLIDLPLTNVAQGYFLGRVLGDDAITLFGESGGGGIRVLPPSRFLDTADCYDIAVNVDSMTEMAAATAQAYFSRIRARAGVFLSVNHEFNPFTVKDMSAEHGIHAASRMPYWLRRGYVDEVFRFS
jgi:hypothetical protein